MARTDDYIRQDRDFIYNTGGSLRGRAQERGDENYGRMGFYTGAADEHYIPFLEGRGGYRPEEIDRIQGQDRLDQMQLTQPQIDALHLTDAERENIRGNAWDRAKFFAPGEDLAAVQGREGYQRGIVDRMGNELTDAIGPGLSVSDRYGSDLDSALTSGASRVRGAIDPTKLGLSGEFIDNYRMTPEQKEQYLNYVARDSTAVSQAEIDRAMEAASAAGMDPMGMASYMERAGRKSRQDTNRAIADARVQADEARANRELNIEDRRLGAERGIAGMRADTELTLQGRELDTAQGRENTRLSSERDVSDRRMGAASTTGQARIGTEQSAADRAQQQRQFNTQQGYNVMGDINDQQMNNERWLATNRQDAELQNRNDVYNRNAYRDQQMTGRTAAVADTRRDDEREARGYLTGQIATTGNREQAERDREIGVYGTQVGGAAASTQAQQQRDAQPKWWEKLLSAGAQVASAGLIGR